MRILYIHSLMFHHRTWHRVVDRLKAGGIDLCLADQATAELLDAPDGDIDLLVADLAVGMPGYDRLLGAGWFITHRIGISPEMPAEFTTFPADTAADFRHYLSAVCAENYENGMRCLAVRLGMQITFEPPRTVLTTGIYHPEAPQPFEDVATYQSWLAERLEDPTAPCIGLLFYYSQLAEENTARRPTSGARIPGGCRTCRPLPRGQRMKQCLPTSAPRRFWRTFLAAARLTVPRRRLGPWPTFAWMWPTALPPVRRRSMACCMAWTAASSPLA